jgi:MFS family permease
MTGRAPVAGHHMALRRAALWSAFLAVAVPTWLALWNRADGSHAVVLGLDPHDVRVALGVVAVLGVGAVAAAWDAPRLSARSGRRTLVTFWPAWLLWSTVTFVTPAAWLAIALSGLTGPVLLASALVWFLPYGIYRLTTRPRGSDRAERGATLVARRANGKRHERAG